VDDFDDVTPELLRVAYVEALYRVDDFEFERLTQSFWLKLIEAISTEKSSRYLFEIFPPHLSVDSTFARPLESFQCSDRGCGDGTKRTPKSSC
jgi:hypothetical protein